MTIAVRVRFRARLCQLCCPASSKLLLGLDLRLGCDNLNFQPFFFKDNEHKLDIKIPFETKNHNALINP